MKMENKVQISQKITRRKFIGVAAGTTAAFTIVPRYVLGGSGYIPPSKKLNVAGVGVGGMGAINIDNIAGIKRDKDGNVISQDKGENIVALCDVDTEFAARTFNNYPKAKQYTDFRKMLEKQKDIEAVVIATPDHTHAVITMASMQLGKHVYTQKPLTWSIHEARVLTEAARKYKVMTQMGNQGRSGEGIRLACEWIWDGAIGEIKQVYAWTNRPIWPQGIDRPKDTPAVPATCDWDVWLGPAPQRPYHPDYHPFKWRGWLDFGTGALGDMACHILDPVFMALKLGRPTSVEASSTGVNSETFPVASIIHYDFPARENMPSVRVTWFDGGLKPPRPEGMEPQRKLGDNGVLFIGNKGVLMCGTYGESPRLVPAIKMQEYNRPPKTIERVDMSHEQDWVRACKTGKPACSQFDYSGPLTEMVLLGNFAVRMGQKLSWDGQNMKVTNVPEANEFVHRQYRQGWSL